jgi:hypothetical protein
MNKNQICIVIPIYKEILNDFEIQSVEQCIEILSDYSIHFVCAKELKVDFYKAKFPEIYNFIFFEEKYFKDLKGFNRLMLSGSFYSGFKKYSYMLIYQTDCFVFRDELLTWSNKGYDYIGGVWFDDFIGNPYLDAKVWYAGNGGLSLRKIKSMMQLLSSKKPLKSFRQLIAEKRKLYNIGKINFLKEIIFLPLNLLGFRNNYNYQAKMHNTNEDVYFVEASLKYKGLKIPKVEDAISFSWDRCPKFLFDYVGHLPFACHAWFREDFPYEGNRNFWSKQIKIK